MPAPAAAVDQQVVWKNEEIKAFAVALVRAALALQAAGTHKFTTDIVRDAERGSGTGIAGSVVTMLKNASVLQAVGFWRDQQFYAERMMSAREGRKSAWNNVYQLTSHAAAVSFLERHGAACPSLKQPELINC
jgi:hypothetical protein